MFMCSNMNGNSNRKQRINLLALSLERKTHTVRIEIINKTAIPAIVYDINKENNDSLNFHGYRSRMSKNDELIRPLHGGIGHTASHNLTVARGDDDFSIVDDVTYRSTYVRLDVIRGHIHEALPRLDTPPSNVRGEEYVVQVP